LFAADPDPGWKDSDPGSRTNIPDLIFEILYQIFGLKILKLFDADPNPGSGNAGFQ
jgi:hypothetical protein